MANTWITKVGHFLNEDGELPAELPGPARNLAEFICSLVQAVTSHSFEALVPTGVRCRRRPKRRPCTGEVFAFLNEPQFRSLQKILIDNIRQWRIIEI